MGTVEWVHQLGTDSNDIASGIAMDQTRGVIYVTGSTSGNLDGNILGGDKDFPSVMSDIFLIKYDERGTRYGTQQFGSAHTDGAYAMDVHQTTGAIYMIGETLGAYDKITIMGQVGQDDIILIKYNLSGVMEWSRQIKTDSGADDIGVDLAVDQTTGAIYITGYTEGTLTGTNMGGKDIIVIKYNASGVEEWTRQSGTSADDIGLGITVDQTTGAIYVTGSTQGSFNGNTNSGEDDIVLIKYTPLGDEEWTRQIGSTRTDFAYDVAIDQTTGAIYMTGQTWGSLDENMNIGEDDIFLIKYNASGVKEWIRQVGTSASDAGIALAVDQTTNAIYITGYTMGTFNGNTNLGEKDVILMKYDSFGVIEWTYQTGTNMQDAGFDIVVNHTTGAIYVVGQTMGTFDKNTHRGGIDIFLIKYK